MESRAPAELESVRALLNTWRVPNDTRTPVDDFARVAVDPDAWAAAMPHIRFPATATDRGAIAELRQALRAALNGDGDLDSLNELLAGSRWRIELDVDNGAVQWSADPSSGAGDALAIVVAAVAAGSWPRLRACPDCRWVFYDTSRNGRRVWCSMTGADGARACGSIAKTRAYRERQRRAPSGTSARSEAKVGH